MSFVDVVVLYLIWIHEPIFECLTIRKLDVYDLIVLSGLSFVCIEIDCIANGKIISVNSPLSLVFFSWRAQAITFKSAGCLLCLFTPIYIFGFICTDAERLCEWMRSFFMSPTSIKIKREEKKGILNVQAPRNNWRETTVSTKYKSCIMWAIMGFFFHRFLNQFRVHRVTSFQFRLINTTFHEKVYLNDYLIFLFLFLYRYRFFYLASMWSFEMVLRCLFGWNADSYQKLQRVPLLNSMTGNMIINSSENCFSFKWNQ